MNTTSHSITTTTVAGTTYSTIALTPEEVTNALLVAEGFGESGLRTATRAGLFSPVSAGPDDTVAVDIKPDASAVIVVVALSGPATTTTFSNSSNSAN